MENFDKVIEYCVGKLEKQVPYVDMSWSEIVSYLELDYHPDNLRKIAYGLQKYHNHVQENTIDSSDDIIAEELIKLKKEKRLISDMKSALNRQINSSARHENILELARECAREFDKNKPLLSNPPIIRSAKNEGLVLLSDWHIGIVNDNHWNKFDVEIAKDRLSFLKQRIIDICLHNNVKKINVCILGDLISGLIHNNLRMENRENVVEQSIIVVEMISEFLSSLTVLFEVDMYYVVGNHERISANKSESLDKENFGYFILEMIKCRCANLKGLTIHKNDIDDEIITFNIFNNKIVATHGNNFGNLNTYIPKLTSMIGYVPDYVCVGHLHQNVENVYGNTELIVNPSLSGVDTYAKNYGLIGKPAQKLMLFSEEYGKEATYCINL